LVFQELFEGLELRGDPGSVQVYEFSITKRDPFAEDAAYL
jgi:hypothetical protein